MKKLAILFIMLLVAKALVAQNIESVIANYIQLIDNGDYNNAISLLKNNKKFFFDKQDGIQYYWGFIINAYSFQGNYQKITNIYEDEKETILQSHNTSSLVTTTKSGTLDIVGYAYCELGQMAKAEECFLKSLELLKTLPEKESMPQLRRVLTHIGRMYVNFKNYDKASLYLRDAKYLYETNLDFGVGYISCLADMAKNYFINGDLLNSKIYNDVCLSFISKISPKDVNAATWAILYSNAAAIYNALGYKNEAANLLEEAINYCNTYKLDDSYKALLYAQQGTLFNSNGDYAKAKRMFRKALQKKRNINYAMELVAAEYLSDDNSVSKTAQSLSKDIINDVLAKFSFFSATERQKYWEHYNPIMTMLSYMMLQGEEQNPAAIYNNALFIKGLLLRESSRINANLKKSENSETTSMENRLRAWQELMSHNTLSADSLRMVNDSINIIDKQLAKISKGHTSSDLAGEYDWRRIKKHLKDKEVAIEFIQLPDTIANDSTDVDWMYYAALVDRNSNKPTLIPLCKEKELKVIFNKDITALNSSGKKSQLNKYVTNIYTTKNPKYTNGERLYSLLWQPISALLDSAATVYYSPTGLLNSISFAAIMHKSVPLAEKHNLIMLSSTLEIVGMHKEKKLINNAALYGGIPYSMTKEDMLSASRGYTHGSTSCQLASRGETRTGLADLSGTFIEAENIKSYLQEQCISATVMSGSVANEESFKALSGKSPSLIHLATHGFFLADAKTISQHPFMHLLNIQEAKTENALNRSGVCFAGANRAWTGVNVISGIEDGILTAEEISHLDLSNTELVVLSACETGLGENLSSEGIFGLQRAFKLAGVKSLIMSLWKVDDVATSEFMSLFYKKWMSGATRHEAFAFAQKKLRQKDEYSSPYYWAGFVMLD